MRNTSNVIGDFAIVCFGPPRKLHPSFCSLLKPRSDENNFRYYYFTVAAPPQFFFFFGGKHNCYAAASFGHQLLRSF
jgi:hypothetical protein